MKFRIWCEFGVWWLDVPPRFLRGREVGMHHRSSYPEILRLMEFYIGRARARVEWVMEHATDPTLRHPQ